MQDDEVMGGRCVGFWQDDTGEPAGGVKGHDPGCGRNNCKNTV